MKKEIDIFSEGANAIVQLPERRFPGLVVQGDTLKSWEEMASEALRALKLSDPAEASDAIGYLCEKLQESLREYERVMNERGFGLPYLKGT